MRVRLKSASGRHSAPEEQGKDEALQTTDEDGELDGSTPTGTSFPYKVVPVDVPEEGATDA